MSEQYNGPFAFELRFKNTAKLKLRDIFIRFIYDDYAMRDLRIGYSASDYDEGDKNSSIFELEFDELGEIFIAGYEFALFVEKEKKQFRLVK